MKAFLDTSALAKKYIAEKGSDEFDELLEKISEILISPLFWIELNSALERRFSEKSLTKRQLIQIRREVSYDMPYFSRVVWNENLERAAVEILKRYPLKTLDSIQLAAGTLSDADFFITSDKQLYRAAQEIFQETKLV